MVGVADGITPVGVTDGVRSIGVKVIARVADADVGVGIGVGAGGRTSAAPEEGMEVPSGGKVGGFGTGRAGDGDEGRRSAMGARGGRAGLVVEEGVV